MLNAGEDMKVITEKVLREYIEQIGDGGVVYAASLINLLEEIDTLTVSKLRPMCDAPNDESIIFLAKSDFNDELEEAWSTGGGEFSTSQSLDLRIDVFEGWIPKPSYKPEK